jgi:hypothetical protein
VDVDVTATSDSLYRATMDQLRELNPALARVTSRVDEPTQKGSVIDVVRMITGENSGHNPPDKAYTQTTVAPT